MTKSTQEIVKEWNDRAARIRAGEEGFRSKEIWEDGWQDRVTAAAKGKGTGLCPIG